MIDPAMLDDLGLVRQPTTSASSTRGELHQEAFLELMVAQFRNQDPLKPMENGDFLGQLAQFGTVSGIEQLQRSVSSLAGSLYSDQALQASGLIGHDVLIPGEVGLLGENGELGAAVQLDRATPGLVLQVTDAGGQLVRRMNLGVRQAGIQEFTWDGRNDNGDAVAPGAYHLAVVGGEPGQQRQLPVLLEARVDSVSLGHAGGVLLNLAGYGEVSLGDVRRIGTSGEAP